MTKASYTEAVLLGLQQAQSLLAAEGTAVVVMVSGIQRLKLVLVNELTD